MSSLNWPTKKEDLLPLSEYLETENSFVIGIKFDPLEDERVRRDFPECPPFIVLCHSSEVYEYSFYEIPKQMAYYAKTHVGYTREGRRNAEQMAVRQYQNQLKSLLGLDDDD